MTVSMEKNELYLLTKGISSENEKQHSDQKEYFVVSSTRQAKEKSSQIVKRTETRNSPVYDPELSIHFIRSSVSLDTERSDTSDSRKIPYRYLPNASSPTSIE
jgi:hypothetical protein